jgi:hypothetical protein
LFLQAGLLPFSNTEPLKSSSAFRGKNGRTLKNWTRGSITFLLVTQNKDFNWQKQASHLVTLLCLF